MSTQPPVPGPPPGAPVPAASLPPAGSLRCPRCSASVEPDQDWCLECGAPARTRLAPTPNWQLPTVALGALVLIAGALFAFAFVKLTDDGSAPASAAPTAVTTAAPVVPPVVAPVVPPPVVPPQGTPTTGTTAPPAPGATTTPGSTTTPGAIDPGRTTATPPGQTTTPPGQTTQPKPQIAP